MTAVSPVLQQIFGAEGAKGVGSLVQSFDFSKIDVKDDKKNNYLHVEVAPAYGTLNAESIKTLDKGVKVMIAGTVRALSAIPPDERTWNKVLSTLMQSPVLEPDVANQIARADRLIKSGFNVWKFDGSPDAGIVRQVEDWFTKLVSDQDVIESTKLDISVLAKIVAQTGATVDSFVAIYYKTEEHGQTTVPTPKATGAGATTTTTDAPTKPLERNMVDIGVLRFPDVSKPSFTLYRIQLTAWSRSTRVLMVQKEENGIVGEYTAYTFKPRESIIGSLSAEATEKAVGQAETLFD